MSDQASDDPELRGVHNEDSEDEEDFEDAQEGDRIIVREHIDKDYEQVLDLLQEDEEIERELHDHEAGSADVDAEVAATEEDDGSAEGQQVAGPKNKNKNNIPERPIAEIKDRVIFFFDLETRDSSGATGSIIQFAATVLLPTGESKYISSYCKPTSDQPWNLVGCQVHKITPADVKDSMTFPDF